MMLAWPLKMKHCTPSIHLYTLNLEDEGQSAEQSEGGVYQGFKCVQEARYFMARFSIPQGPSKEIGNQGLQAFINSESLGGGPVVELKFENPVDALGRSDVVLECVNSVGSGWVFRIRQWWI